MFVKAFQILIIFTTVFRIYRKSKNIHTNCKILEYAQSVSRVFPECAEYVFNQICPTGIISSGTILDDIRPFLTIQDHLCPPQTFQTIWGHLLQTSRTISDYLFTMCHHLTPSATICHHLIPSGTLLVNLWLSGTISAHRGLYNSNSDHLTPSPS